MNNYIENNEVRRQVTSRGGGIEISLKEKGFPGGLMSAYQNSLGGGMLGAVVVNANIEIDTEELQELADSLKEYYFNLTDNGLTTFEQNQRLSVSAY